MVGFRYVRRVHGLVDVAAAGAGDGSRKSRIPWPDLLEGIGAHARDYSQTRHPAGQ